VSTASPDIEFAYRLSRGAFRLDAEGSAGTEGVTGLFGASGAGKTSLLRCIAGLDVADSAHLVVRGERIDDSANGRRCPVHRRDIAYVFQEPRLFPHLDVRRNLEYGARRRPSPGRDAFETVVDRLSLGTLLSRKPAGLSGGEAQRVAIGRALLSAPKLLLMDEPVAALDAARRRDILDCVKELRAATGIPVLYVSHQLDEVCRLCDQLLVLEDGRVVASGPLQSVLLRTDLPVLGGADAGVVFDAVAVAYDPGDDLSELAIGALRLFVPERHAPGEKVRVRVRASDVSISRDGSDASSSILNRLPAVLAGVRDDGTHAVLLELRLPDGAPLLARITRRSLRLMQLRPDDSVVAQVKSISVRG